MGSFGKSKRLYSFFWDAFIIPVLVLIVIVGRIRAQKAIANNQDMCIWYNDTKVSGDSGENDIVIWKWCHKSNSVEYIVAADQVDEWHHTKKTFTKFSKVTSFQFVGSELLGSFQRNRNHITKGDNDDYVAISHLFTCPVDKSDCETGVRTLGFNLQCCDDDQSVDESNEFVYKSHTIINDCLTVLDICSQARCRIKNEISPLNRDKELGTGSNSSCEATYSNVSDTDDEIRAALGLRSKAMDLFMHGYNKYLEHAFPWDELKPLSCSPRRWDKRERGTLDDTLGGFALTLVDSLDGLAVMGRIEDFKTGIRYVKEHVSFSRDVTISLFETTIRVLGGLLSAHMIALKLQDDGFDVGYDEYFLLDLAADLGDRLLPAFNTPTGIPYHRVNLMKGVMPGETSRTCTAAAGTLLLEFGTLSRLSGFSKYEKAAKKAMKAIWSRRSRPSNLVGNLIDVRSGTWLSNIATTGAGVDSFYEYLWKCYKAFGEEQYKTVFKKAYDAVQREMKFGPWHLETDLHQGGRKLSSGFIVSALQAFWPGLQVSYGEITEAEKTHRGYYEIWKMYGAMPEVFDVLHRKTHRSGSGKAYYLRPELAESTMMLYQATEDKYYALEVGKRILEDIEKNTKVKCGFAAIGDVHTGSLEDRMDSYVLAETLKYLYMLFDLAVPEHLRSPGSWTTWKTRNGNQETSTGVSSGDVVFTTEGHVIFTDMTKREAASKSDKDESKPKANSKQGTFKLKRNKNSPESYLATIKLQQMVLASLDQVEHPNPTDLQATILNQGASFAMEAAQAAFGSKFDKTPTQFILAYAEPRDACSPITNSDEIMYVSDAASKMRSALGTKVEAALLIDRGGCTFLEKMRHAHDAGARAVFVVNSRQKKIRMNKGDIAVDNNEPINTMKIGQNEEFDSEIAQQIGEMRALMIPQEVGLILQHTPRSLWGGSRSLYNSSHHVVIEIPTNDVVKPLKKSPKTGSHLKVNGVYPVEQLVQANKNSNNAILDVLNSLVSDMFNLGPK